MRNPINSSDLDKRLKQLVQKKQKIEEEYRETSQRFWTIAFIDVSSSAKGIWDQGEEEANQLFATYQQIVRQALDYEKASFIEQGGGPQIVCAFSDAEGCLLAAQFILCVLADFSKTLSDDSKLIPSIGIHQGYVNFHDGTIHQSNTTNKAKRIQSQASPGQVFVSREIQEELAANPQFAFTLIGSFSLKNIPELQDIFEVSYRVLAEINAFSVPIAPLPVSGPTPDGSNCESYQWIFIYIDVCESTKKFWKFGDLEASRLIKEYQKLCHTTFQQCGCAYVKSCEGDQIIGAFEPDDVNSAVVAAIKILKDLFRRNVHVRETCQVRAAIGIHCGEVILQDGAPVTTGDMRVGKAIQSQASADEILLSNRVSQTLDSDLRKYLVPLGSSKFSGIPEPYDIDRLNWTRVQLRPSLLHPPHRRKSSLPRISY